MFKQILTIVILCIVMIGLCYWSLMNNSNYGIKKAIESQTTTCERIQNETSN